MLGLTKLLIRPNGPDSEGFLAVTDDGGQSWTISDEDELMRATGESAAYWMKKLRLVAETFALGMGYLPTTPEIVGVLQGLPGSEIIEESLPRAVEDDGVDYQWSASPLACARCLYHFLSNLRHFAT